MELHLANKDLLLYTAIVENNEKTVKFLLKHGANANARLKMFKESLLRLISNNYGNPEVQEMFSRFRNFSLNMNPHSCVSFPIPIMPYKTYSFRNRRTRSEINETRDMIRALTLPTPMHVASANGVRSIMEMLIDKDGDVDALMEGEYTPLVISILCKNYDMVELLLNKGANVNKRFSRGRMPLHFAVKTEKIEIVELLLRHGSDVNAHTDFGVTALHVAVDRKLLDITELLLKNGSEVNVCTKTGVTPLHCAAVNGHREITEMILNYGADVNAIMNKGEVDVSPLLWVTDIERKKITDLLNKHVEKTSQGGYYSKLFRKFLKRFSTNK